VPLVARRRFDVVRLGRRHYAPVHELQKRLNEERARGERPDTILVVEHEPVVTMGRGGHAENVLVSKELLREHGYDFEDVGRGGDVTYHGPGQLVLYPIVDLRPDRQDVRRYVRDLEETMIRTCADFGLVAKRVDGLNGAWIGDRKVGAVGVRISRWVTMHGLALNVTTDLSQFGVIVPCGISGRGVTSLARELAHDVSLEDVTVYAIRHFASLFDADLVEAPVSSVEPAASSREPDREL